MKKTICVFLLVVLSLSVLTACGKFTCADCLEKKTGTQHIQERLGKEVAICEDCYNASLEKTEFFCESCEQRKFSRQYKDQLLGREYLICEDCYNGLQK